MTLVSKTHKGVKLHRQLIKTQILPLHINNLKINLKEWDDSH